jgi:U3 small nucleolar RNA-associated protein 7
MWKETHSYLTHKPVSSLAVSQTGAVAVGFGSHVQVWRDGLMTKSKAPYMRHELPGSRVSSVRWRPFEDVLGLGHSNGFTSLVIPGTGEANYDALEHNPFESRKERREAEVHRLLDKLPPETIALNQEFLGRVDVDPKLLKEEQTALQAQDEAKKHEGQPEGREKRRMRGRSKIGAQLKRKRKNIIDSVSVETGRSMYACFFNGETTNRDLGFHNRKIRSPMSYLWPTLTQTPGAPLPTFTSPKTLL